MKRLSSIVISLFIVFGVFLYLIDFMALDLSYYNNFHKQYNISENTGLSDEWINEASGSLVKFLKNGDEDILKNNFNSKEISHMRDVYFLFKLNRFVYKTLIFTAIIFILYKMNFKDREFFKSMSKNFLKVYFTIIALFGVCALFFSESFIYFHKIFFTNDLWLLDYDTDMMIRILPEEFFFTLFTNVMVLATIINICVYLFFYMKGSSDRYGN